jgi:hypothetical protein
MEKTRNVSLMRTGDVVAVGLLRPSRWYTVKRLERLRELRLNQRRTKVWSVSSTTSLSGFFSKFWLIKLICGRIGWLRKTGGLIRFGLYGKCRKQLIYSVIFVEARNIILSSVLLSRTGGRRVLSFVAISRLQKLRRVFPLRRMNRKFKKVK